MEEKKESEFITRKKKRKEKWTTIFVIRVVILYFTYIFESNMFSPALPCVVVLVSRRVCVCVVCAFIICGV